MFPYYVILIGLGPFLAVGILVVQILLSKKSSPLFGWIMPLLSFLLSLFFSVGTYQDFSKALPPLIYWNLVTLVFIVTFFLVRHFKKKGAWDKAPEAEEAAEAPEESE